MQNKARQGSESEPVSAVLDTDLVEALLAASRALVALAARSLGDLDVEVTLPQYRALVVLASRGPQRVMDIATELGVAPSTATRLCDRLVRKGLMGRAPSPTDRRAVTLTLTGMGFALVQQVTDRRRRDLARIVAGLPQLRQSVITQALTDFAVAAGETPHEQWWLGWGDVTEIPKHQQANDIDQE